MQICWGAGSKGEGWTHNLSIADKKAVDLNIVWDRDKQNHPKT